MAEVAQDAKLSEWIEDYLDYLFMEWGGIPDLAAEWPEWDDESRLTFALDWPICEDRLQQLHGWAEQGLLTPNQQARHDELLQLVAENRPTLQRLLTQPAA
jgi:hypothetical protein